MCDYDAAATAARRAMHGSIPLRIVWCVSLCRRSLFLDRSVDSVLVPADATFVPRASDRRRERVIVRHRCNRGGASAHYRAYARLHALTRRGVTSSLPAIVIGP